MLNAGHGLGVTLSRDLKRVLSHRLFLITLHKHFSVYLRDVPVQNIQLPIDTTVNLHILFSLSESVAWCKSYLYYNSSYE